MSRLRYAIREECCELDKEKRISYGIVAYDNDDEDDVPTIFASVGNITDDREALARLVELCNSLELSPTHLLDVVEDFLNN